MAVHREHLSFANGGRGTTDITAQVSAVVARAKLGEGLCNVFISHTSASLMICENADPQVRVDLERFFARLVPDGDPLFGHTDEGPDDMPAHVRSVLTQPSLSVPVVEGRLMLGTWQGIYLFEHRHAAHTRHVVVTVVGEA